MRWFVVVALGLWAFSLFPNPRPLDFSRIPWERTSAYWTILGNDSLELQMSGSLLLPEWSSPKTGYWLLIGIKERWATAYRVVFAHPERHRHQWIWRWISLPEMETRLHGHLVSRSVHQENGRFTGILSHLDMELARETRYVVSGMCTVHKVEVLKEVRAEGLFEIVTGAQHSRRRMQIQMDMNDVQNVRLTLSRRCVLWLTGG